MANLSPRPLPQTLIAVSTTGFLGARFINFPGVKGSKPAGFPDLPWLEVVSSPTTAQPRSPPAAACVNMSPRLPLLARSWQDARDARDTLAVARLLQVSLHARAMVA